MIDSVLPAWDADALLALAPTAGSVAAFEAELLAVVGFGPPVAVPSGRWAIQSALTALRIGPGDEVVLPAFLCSAVADAVIATGARPVLCDVELPNGCPSAATLEPVLGRATRAAILPHLFGVPEDYSEVRSLLDLRGIHMIEDCAHTLGASVGGLPAGAASTCAVFSFSYDKPIALGGGGAVAAGQRAPGGFEAALRAAASRCNPGGSAHAERAELVAMARWFAARAVVGDGEAFRFVGWGLRLAAGGRRFVERGRRPGDSMPGMLRCELGRSLIGGYGLTRSKRNANAQIVRDAAVAAGLAAASLSGNAQAAYLRFNAVGATAQRAVLVARRLRSEGFRAGPMNWPMTLDAIPGVAAVSRVPSSPGNAHAMAARSVNIPIHQALSGPDCARLVSVLAGTQ